MISCYIRILNKYKVHFLFSTITLLLGNNFNDFNAIFSIVCHYLRDFMHFLALFLSSREIFSRPVSLKELHNNYSL